MNASKGWYSTVDAALILSSWEILYFSTFLFFLYYSNYICSLSLQENLIYFFIVLSTSFLPGTRSETGGAEESVLSQLVFTRETFLEKREVPRPIL